MYSSRAPFWFKSALIFSALLLQGCSSIDTPYKQQLVDQCLRSTQPRTSARWDCISRSNDQAVAQQARDDQEQQRRAEVARVDQVKQRCAVYGFQPGTPAFSQCLQNEVHQAEAIQQSRNMMIQQGDAQAARDQQEQFRRAQCYGTGRLDCL